MKHYEACWDRDGAAAWMSRSVVPQSWNKPQSQRDEGDGPAEQRRQPVVGRGGAAQSPHCLARLSGLRAQRGLRGRGGPFLARAKKTSGAGTDTRQEQIVLLQWNGTPAHYRPARRDRFIAAPPWHVPRHFGSTAVLALRGASPHPHLLETPHLSSTQVGRNQHAGCAYLHVCLCSAPVNTHAFMQMPTCACVCVSVCKVLHRTDAAFSFHFPQIDVAMIGSPVSPWAQSWKTMLFTPRGQQHLLLLQEHGPACNDNKAQR